MSRKTSSGRLPCCTLDPSLLSFAMLGLVFPLFVIFVCIAPAPIVHRAFEPTSFRYAIALPRSLREDAVRITVTRDGAIYFRNQKTSTERLPQQIREAIRNGAERKVYLEVDGRCHYADLGVVLDEVRSTGIQQTAFVEEMN